MAELDVMGVRNELLLLMSDDDQARLAPHLERVPLDLRTSIEQPGQPIRHIYFPETAIVSIVVVGNNDERIEIGLIGREGMTGIAVVLGSDRSPHDAFIQAPGSGLRIATEKMLEAIHGSASLRSLCLAYAHSFAIQTAHTALANGRQKLEGRLARWLLMSLDRIEGDELPLTHEFISDMLGVRRPGVTVAIHNLEAHGLIRASRSKIHILDRKGLEESAGGFYGAPEQEYRRLITGSTGRASSRPSRAP